MQNFDTPAFYLWYHITRFISVCPVDFQKRFLLSCSLLGNGQGMERWTETYGAYLSIANNRSVIIVIALQVRFVQMPLQLIWKHFWLWLCFWNFTSVYAFLHAGTIEEKIYQRQISKQALSGAVVDLSKGAEHIRFSVEELRNLFILHEDSKCVTHELLECKCMGKKEDQGEFSFPFIRGPF